LKLRFHEASFGKHLKERPLLNGTEDSVGPSSDLCHLFRSHISVQHNVGHLQTTSRAKHSMQFAQHFGFIRAQVENAVGDYCIYGPIGHGQILGIGKMEFDVGYANCYGVAPSLVEHGVRHVDADDLPLWSNPPCSEDAIQPGPAPQI
jgi:hypothetical protein